MSNQITEAFVKQFGSNVYHLSQQKNSRLSPYVRNESQHGSKKFFDRLGSVTAQRKVSRHGDTPLTSTPHSRRMVSLADYEHADLIDEVDKIKILIDPTSAYAMAFAMAFGRAMDNEIIDNASGNAYSGEEGTTAVPFPDAQRLAAVDGVATTGVNLNIQTLRLCKAKFDVADVDESIPRYFAYTSSQLQALLGTTQVTSSDFNTVKALVQGEIDTFLGFKFIRTQLLKTTSASYTYDINTGVIPTGSSGTLAAGARICLAWAQDGLILSKGIDPKTRVGERADKSYSAQVFMNMSIGATRMEEVKVVEVLCKE